MQPPAAPPQHGLVWEDPPPRGGGNTQVFVIVALVPELRRNPGKWARLYTWKNLTGANSMQTKLRALPELSDCEFIGRSNKAAGTSALYGRYLERDGDE